jgi:hypothetical protein
MRGMIDEKILQQAVAGVNLRPGTFADQIAMGEKNAPQLLVFLRHFG